MNGGSSVLGLVIPQSITPSSQTSSADFRFGGGTFGRRRRRRRFFEEHSTTDSLPDHEQDHPIPSGTKRLIAVSCIDFMARKILYWVSTGTVGLMCLFAGFGYLSGGPQAVQGFAHVGYPQQLRIILGIAKPLAGIVLLIPGLLRLKEWAYAGLTFAWISAFIAHHLAKDGAEAFAPLVLLVLLAVSYVTRPVNRTLAPGD